MDLDGFIGASGFLEGVSYFANISSIDLVLIVVDLCDEYTILVGDWSCELLHLQLSFDYK